MGAIRTSANKKYASTYDFVVLELQKIEEGTHGSAKPLTDKSASMQRPNMPSEIMVAELLNIVKGDAAKYIPVQDSSDTRYSREMDTVKDLEKQNKILKERVEYWKGQTKRTSTKKADSAEVRRLGREMWSAAEDYVQGQGIQKGTPEYEAAVNQTYTDIIRKSQPNYTTTERSDLLRDQRAHMKLLTMFKTQSNQNFNLLLEANGEFIRAKQDLKNGRNGVTEADVKAAGKKLANASTGVLLGGTVSFVALRTIMNFIMGVVDPYRDDETDEVTLEATLEGIGKEILSSLAGTVALGGQVYDILMPLITGDTYYGLSDSAVSSLSDMMENTVKVFQNGTDATGTQKWKMVNSWCMAFGIPAGNAKKIITMIDTYKGDIKNGTFGQYYSSRYSFLNNVVKNEDLIVKKWFFEERKRMNLETLMQKNEDIIGKNPPSLNIRWWIYIGGESGIRTHGALPHHQFSRLAP